MIVSDPEMSLSGYLERLHRTGQMMKAFIEGDEED